VTSYFYYSSWARNVYIGRGPQLYSRFWKMFELWVLHIYTYISLAYCLHCSGAVFCAPYGGNISLALFKMFSLHLCLHMCAILNVDTDMFKIEIFHGDQAQINRNCHTEIRKVDTSLKCLRLIWYWIKMTNLCHIHGHRMLRWMVNVESERTWKGAVAA
jgi:hypothetical protein